nr:hypothetical protein [Tanacetum cinerariifolium]
FGDSYKAPPEETAKDKGLAGEVSSSKKKKRRTVAITAEDMQKRKNDVKVRTTLLLALLDEYQLRFSKYDSAKEQWEAILKTFGGNEATKKTKKNQLKQQYGNFKAEGSETLEQNFIRLQAIVSHLEFMDVPIEQDDLNHKFLTSLAPEWLVYTIVWRNRDDLDTMSLDDVYNHLKVYEPEIDDDDIEKMDIKWNLALLSMRADRFWKKTGKKITIQGSDVAGFDKSKLKCFNCYKMSHFARECRSPRIQDRGKRESYKKDPRVEELAPKTMAMIAIDGIGWDWSYMAEKDEASKNHALVANEEEVPTKYALMAKSSSSSDNRDETSRILRNFITKIENLKDLNVKIIKSDNGGEFRNKEMDEFFSRKGIKREFSNARTPQQNGVAKRRNRTLIEAVKTMLANAKLPVTFWAEAVNTACKFDTKGDEGYFVGYSLSSKAFRVFNKRTKKIEENLHVDFLENKSIEKGTGPDWLFDIDTLTNSMSYIPVIIAGTSSTNISGTKEDVHQAVKEKKSPLRFIALLNWFHEAQMASSNEAASKDDVIPVNNAPQQNTKVSTNDSFELVSSSTVETKVPTVSTHVPTDSLYVPLITSSVPIIISRGGSSFPEPLSLGNVMSFENRLEDFFRDTYNAVSLNEVEVDLSNMETAIQVSLTLTLRIHKDHPKSQIIGHVDTPVQTRQKTKNVDEQSFIVIIHQKTNPNLLQYCLFSCFLSQEEHKKIVDALKDPSWVEAMQQELLQFKILNVWVLVNCPSGVRPTGTKWVLKNKKDERGIVIRNKARLVAQRHTQEEGIDYKEFFAPVARIEAIRLFLAYASYMGFTVYQMDVKSTFLYGTIDEEADMMQPLGFQDLEFPHRVYKVEKAMYGLHQALRAWYGTLSKYLLDSGFQRDIRTAKTPMDRENPWGKDETKKDVELHLYRSMIRSLMHLIASKPDIIFVVCACARHQVTPKECHLHAVKRIFRYLKSNSKLGLWYPKESPFDLVAYSDSDYGGANQDRKSTTRGCQFLGRRLISWQCKKQTIMATSTTEAEYVAAASGCGQVLWIQNQLLDYEYNFLNTKIYMDNNSAICIVKNPVYHSKTKHIEIRHHFIRDCYENKLINVDHIYIDDNVADLLTKAFDVGRFQYLVVSIGMLNP